MSTFKRNPNDQYIELVEASSSVRSLGDGDDSTSSFSRIEDQERKSRIRRIAILVLAVTLCTLYLYGVVSSSGVGHKYKNYYGYLPGQGTTTTSHQVPTPWATIATSSTSTDSPTESPTMSCDDECPSYITLPDCSNKEQPVLGGVDLVSFHSLTNDDDVGLTGSSDYQYTYNGYTYYFVDKTNMKLFKNDPDYYLPAYGGYCAWGISGEYCPDYYWKKDCLGPSSNWGIWTIQNERLYLFLKQTAKDNFMNDIDNNIKNGDERWDNWYSNSSNDTIPINTRCYYISADDTINHALEFINQ